MGRRPGSRLNRKRQSRRAGSPRPDRDAASRPLYRPDAVGRSFRAVLALGVGRLGPAAGGGSPCADRERPCTAKASVKGAEVTNGAHALAMASAAALGKVDRCGERLKSTRPVTRSTPELPLARLALAIVNHHSPPRRTMTTWTRKPPALPQGCPLTGLRGRGSRRSAGRAQRRAHG